MRAMKWVLFSGAVGLCTQACSVSNDPDDVSEASSDDMPEVSEDDVSTDEVSPTEASAAPASMLGGADNTSIASNTNFGPLVQYASPEPAHLTVHQTEDGAALELRFIVQDDSGNGVSVQVVPYTSGVSEWAVDDGVDGGLGVSVWGSSMEGTAMEGELLISYPDSSSIQLELQDVVIAHRGDPDNILTVTSTSSLPGGVITAELELTCGLLGDVVGVGSPGLVSREPPYADEDWSSEFCQQARLLLPEIVRPSTSQP